MLRAHAPLLLLLVPRALVALRLPATPVVACTGLGTALSLAPGAVRALQVHVLPRAVLVALAVPAMAPRLLSATSGLAGATQRPPATV